MFCLRRMKFLKFFDIDYGKWIFRNNSIGYGCIISISIVGIKSLLILDNPSSHLNMQLKNCDLYFSSAIPCNHCLNCCLYPSSERVCVCRCCSKVSPHYLGVHSYHHCKFLHYSIVRQNRMLSVRHRDRISASVPVDRLQVHECFSFCSFIKLIIVLKYVSFQVFVKIEKYFIFAFFEWNSLAV